MTTISAIKTDQAIVNVPLSKRGNIDGQIDSYKRDQQAMVRTTRKAAAITMKAQQREAKELFQKFLLNRDVVAFDAMADRIRVTPAALLKEIKSLTHWEPAKALRVLADRKLWKEEA